MAAEVDNGQNVLRVRINDAESLFGLEPHVVAKVIRVPPRVTGGVLGRDEEVLRAVDLAVPLHAGKLLGVGRTAREEFRRRTRVDDLVRLTADVPTDFDWGGRGLGIIKSGARTIELSGGSFRIHGFGDREGNSLVVVERVTERILLHLAANLTEEVALVGFGNDIHVQGAILLEPWIVDEVVPNLRGSNEAEAFVEGLGVAAGLAASFVWRHADFIIGDVGDFEQLLEGDVAVGGKLVHASGDPIEILLGGSIGVAPDGRGDEPVTGDVDIRGIIPNVRSIEGVSVDANLFLDVLARRNKIALHEILKGREETEVRRNELMPIQNSIHRALANIVDVAEWVGLDGVRTGFLADDRRFLHHDSAHSVRHIWRPRNAIRKEFLPYRVTAAHFGVHFLEVVWEFGVEVLVLFRPNGDQILVDRR